MSVILTFPGGVRVWSERAGEVVQEYGDELLRALGGRLVPVKDRRTLYYVRRARWVRRQIAKMPPLSASQRALGARAREERALARRRRRAAA